MGGGGKSRPNAGSVFIDKKKSRPLPQDTPAVIRRKINRSFEVAERQLADVAKLKHPENKNLKCVEALPLLPDLDAFPDSGTYVTMKFVKPPMPVGTKTYDRRLSSAIFRPIPNSDKEETEHNLALEAHKKDPENNPKPPPNTDYSLFLAASAADAEKFRVKFDPDYPARDDKSLYTSAGQNGANPCFAFERLRSYETVKETELDHDTKYSHSALLAIANDDDLEGQKGAFYYPVMQHSDIRPQRQKRIDVARGVSREEGQEELIDQLEVRVKDPSHKMMEECMLRYKEDPLNFHGGSAEENGEEDADGSAAER
jgi:RNA polymerase II-associated factor 1